MEQNQKIRISVRSLVEFILRSGDIDNRRSGGPMEKEAMQEGSRIHRKIQGRMGSTYRAEVPLSIDIEGKDYVLTVEGRADGIFRESFDAADKMMGVIWIRPDDPWMPQEEGDGQQRLILSQFLDDEDTNADAGTESGTKADTGAETENEAEEDTGAGSENGAKADRDAGTDAGTEFGERIYIDEIKGVYRDVMTLDAPYSVHLAQAKCYAYIYGIQNHLAAVGVQMTYCNLESEEIRRFRQAYRIGELEVWFDELISQYHKWAEYQKEWKEIRQASIAGLEFPFPWREGQKKVAGDVYRTMLRKKKLFIQAPTGTGKTISTIFPAVKAVGEGLADRIFLRDCEDDHEDCGRGNVCDSAYKGASHENSYADC